MNSVGDSLILTKLELLGTNQQNVDFLKNLKDLVQCIPEFDNVTTENQVLKEILPAILSRFERIYNDNFSLSETSGDDIVNILMKENLEVAFELTEVLQEILNFLGEQHSLYLNNFETVIKNVLYCISLFITHWKSSSNSYKTSFNEEINKVLEVLKHLYFILLHILEFSLSVEESDSLLLAEVLVTICEISQSFFEIDIKTSTCSWKSFGSLCAKYSEILENTLDIGIPINTLSEGIYTILSSFFNKDFQLFNSHLKILVFLLKLLFKISNIFHHQVNKFSLELLMFFVKILNLTLDQFKSQNLPSEFLIALDTEVYQILDVFLHHLVMSESIFKDQIKDISHHKDNLSVFKENPIGVLTVSYKTLKILSSVSIDYPDLTISLIETIFDTLPSCHKELFYDSYNEGIYQQLIITISAAILLQDVNGLSINILTKNVLQEDVFAALLACEVFTLVSCNVPAEDCMFLLLNLLYGINDLQFGFFTNRPELVYLKALLQRMFQALPSALKDEVVKLFNPMEYPQMWSLIGFSSLSPEQSQRLLNLVIENTVHCISCVYKECSEDIPLNIAESLDLVATTDDMNINDLKICNIMKFIKFFWETSLNSSVLDNNIMRYFFSKLSGITLVGIKNNALDPQVVFSKLTMLSCKEGYWVTVYRIIDYLLNSWEAGQSITHIANIITVTLQNKSDVVIQENYLQLLRDLNKSKNSTLNTLLDSLNANVAYQIFQYLEEPVKISTTININRGNFKHKCLQWNELPSATDTYPQIKRSKIEGIAFSHHIKNKVKTDPSIYKAKKSGDISSDNTVNEVHDDDDSSATDVINRLKGEMKCLMKVCKTEPLTAKNVADLRILMSQMSSIMR